MSLEAMALAVAVASGIRVPVAIGAAFPWVLAINSNAEPISRALHDKHYLRKHGKAAYYGQRS